ncbi:MAG: amidase [Anaerolineales bacterium]
MYAKKEPRMHAFIPEPARFDRLRREARELEKRYANPEDRPPLYGLLLGVKDIFHVDSLPTQAGSRLPAKELKGNEAKSVSQLKEAGTLIAGKTVTTEFAYFAPGPTHNPHHLEHTPGGSSSGSAAAVAAGLVDLALGTQTIGSIIRPASYCGVVGYKPSYGRVSTEGVIPLALSLDHVGIFAQEVSLIQRAAYAIVNGWKKITALKNKPFLAIPTGDYLQSASSEMREHFAQAVDRLGKSGYYAKTLDVFHNFKHIVERHNTILAAQAAQTHAKWFDVYKHLYHPKTSELIERGLHISDQTLKQALDDARTFSLNLSTLMDLHGIDLWISPGATGPAPKGLGSTGDPVMNLPWTQAGFPTLGLPSGDNEAGLPLGIQLTADFNRDEDLLGWGLEIESMLKAE